MTCFITPKIYTPFGIFGVKVLLFVKLLVGSVNFHAQAVVDGYLEAQAICVSFFIGMVYRALLLQ